MENDPTFSSLEVALFWTKVKPTRNCWEWKAGHFPNGYGSFKWRGVNYQAHRIAWQILNGRVLGPGEYVLHHCDNKNCVRPDHLFTGSQLLNMQDKIAKGRDEYAHGDDHYQAKLTTEIVKEIRQRHATGERSFLLAKEFGVHPSTMCDLIRRRTWKHIP